MDDKLNEYAMLAATIKKAEARQRVVKAEIEAELGEAGEVKKDYGTFKMVSRTSYEYSDTAKKMAEDLKIRQQDEQEQEIAIPTVAWGLRFTTAKVK